MYTPILTKEQAYWHGYLNGQVDCCKMKPSLEQQDLAKDWVSKGKFN